LPLGWTEARRTHPAKAEMRGWDQTPEHDEENAGTSLRLHVFVVMTNQDIPATNNGPERALRPCATFRKFTDGFPTERGPNFTPTSAPSS
jgi:hypothetical protein